MYLSLSLYIYIYICVYLADLGLLLRDLGGRPRASGQHITRQISQT